MRLFAVRNWLDKNPHYWQAPLCVLQHVDEEFQQRWITDIEIDEVDRDINFIVTEDRQSEPALNIMQDLRELLLDSALQDYPLYTRYYPDPPIEVDGERWTHLDTPIHTFATNEHGAFALIEWFEGIEDKFKD